MLYTKTRQYVNIYWRKIDETEEREEMSRCYTRRIYRETDRTDGTGLKHLTFPYGRLAGGGGVIQPL